MTTHQLELSDATIAYDQYGEVPPPDGRPVLIMIGQPMTAEGFATVAGLMSGRTVVAYDPRGLGRSTRSDGLTTNDPRTQAEDVHVLIESIGGPVDLFASSGGAVTSLALVAAHPEDVRTLVAHEPPLLRELPDADRAVAAEAAVQRAYQERGTNYGMAAFIALTSWHGPFTQEYADQPLPDPAAFGMPTEDDGSRNDPLLSGVSNPITALRPDWTALRSAPTRIVIAVGEESADQLAGRGGAAAAQRLGTEPVVFPSHHGGFLGGEFGYAGQPEAFAAKLTEVLDRT